MAQLHDFVGAFPEAFPQRQNLPSGCKVRHRTRSHFQIKQSNLNDLWVFE